MIASIVIPDTVTSIGDSAFRGIGIVNLILGESVATIGNDAFSNNMIASVSIPDSVVSIGSFAFDGNGITILQLGIGLNDFITKVKIFGFLNPKYLVEM